MLHLSSMLCQLHMDGAAVAFGCTVHSHANILHFSILLYADSLQTFGCMHSHAKIFHFSIWLHAGSLQTFGCSHMQKFAFYIWLLHSCANIWMHGCWFAAALTCELPPSLLHIFRNPVRDMNFNLPVSANIKLIYQP